MGVPPSLTTAEIYMQAYERIVISTIYGTEPSKSVGKIC